MSGIFLPLSVFTVITSTIMGPPIIFIGNQYHASPANRSMYSA